MIYSRTRLSSTFCRLCAQLSIIVAAWCAAAGAALACNVPVFRYALERWPPDPYHLAVFHAGGEEGEESVRNVLKSLEDQPVNLLAEAVDADQIEADDWRLTDVELDRENLPWAVLRYPPRGGQVPPVAWAGTFDPETLKRLTNSSVRQEIARRLLTGESAVWILVESGNREKDEAARKILERDLAEIKGKLQIPGLQELDYSPTDPEAADATAPPAADTQMSPFNDPADAIPLKVDFSLLSLSRDHAAEQGLLSVLLHSEPDLHEYADQPMAFPVFGQGRALWALVGKGINAENIFESCAFLTGPCSCQIKSMNPGTDLLMDFDWQGALEGRVPPPPEISPDMLTAVAPLLDEDDEAMHSGQAAATAALEEYNDADARGGSPELASAAAGSPAAPQGPESTHASYREAGGMFVIVTGAVLGGLLLVVATATVVILGKKKE